MQEKPKKGGGKEAFLYLLLGLFFALFVIGSVSLILLSTAGTPITINSLIQLHLTTPLLLMLDFFGLYSSILMAWVGLVKGRSHTAQTRLESGSKTTQAELAQLQTVWAEAGARHTAELGLLQEQIDSAAEENQKHLGEIGQLQEQLAGQTQAETAFQEEISRLQAQAEGQAEQENRHLAELVLLRSRLDEQEKTFQSLESVITRGKQQWEATFDAVNDLIVLTDDSGCILRCNKATAEIFKLGFNQVIGQQIDDLFLSEDGSPRDTAPGGRMELKVPQLAGWYEISKNHLMIDSQQQGWVYIFRDINLQKQAMQEQQRLTNYYGLLVKNNPVALVTMNMDDRIIDCNPGFENLFLYNKREALGWKADVLISTADQAAENEWMTEAVHKGEMVHRVTQLRRKDGSVLDAEVFWIPVVLGGKQVGSLGIYHDVSELLRSRGAEQGIIEETPELAVADGTEPVETAELLGPAVEMGAVEDELEPILEQIETPVETFDLTAGSPAPAHKRVTPIEKIEGIGPVYAGKLAEISIKTTGDLLEQGKSRKGREELAEKTGISHVLILKWVNMADLMRVRGIGEEYSELLEKAGVDTVKELRNRNPNNLYQALTQANEAHKLVRRAPHLSEVEGWVEDAKKLEAVMTY